MRYSDQDCDCQDEEHVTDQNSHSPFSRNNPCDQNQKGRDDVVVPRYFEKVKYVVDMVVLSSPVALVFIRRNLILLLSLQYAVADMRDRHLL